MNVRIKTAHGYLSFQPDGRIEYRPGAGAWENIELEGLVLEPVPGPDPQPNPDPDPEPIPVPGVPPAPTAAYVASVKAQCLAAGIDLSGPCGAFQITKRVAWGLRAQGVGLVSKPGGNNCEKCSVDWLCYENGDGADILGDAGGSNTPLWSFHAGEFAGQNRWVKPGKP